MAACGVIASSRIYLANVAEAAQEAGEATPQELLRNHPLPGFDYALLKNGRWGTTLLDGGETTAIPAFRVAASSTVGSGDVFAGALAAGLAREEDIRAASVRAAAAAAVAISEGSPLLDDSARRKAEEMLATGHRTYVDPVHVGEVAVALNADSEAELQQLASDLKAHIRNLGLRVCEILDQPTVGVVLRRDEEGIGIVADMWSHPGWTRRIQLSGGRGLRELVDAIADCVEATQ